MSHVDAAARGTVANRPTASRKLLTRKAAERAAEQAPGGEALEDSFPAAEAGEDQAAATSDVQASDEGSDSTIEAQAVADVPQTGAPAVQAPVSGGSEPSATAQAAQPNSAPSWSEADESAFAAMAARRKAAGYQRRGRAVGGQLLRVGEVAPNTGTVAAAIVALVAERGTVSRGDLVAAMGAAAFPHPKARPADKGWCVGYIAGGMRDGFLAEVTDRAFVVAVDANEMETEQ